MPACGMEENTYSTLKSRTGTLLIHRKWRAPHLFGIPTLMNKVLSVSTSWRQYLLVEIGDPTSIPIMSCLVWFSSSSSPIQTTHWIRQLLKICVIIWISSRLMSKSLSKVVMYMEDNTPRWSDSSFRSLNNKVQAGIRWLTTFIKYQTSISYRTRLSLKHF